jgi:hypothetical protein
VILGLGAALWLAGAAHGLVTSVTPAPGARLSPGQYITLEFSPPMSQTELGHLNDLIEIRDERRGRMYWFAAGVGNPPYSRVTLVPDDNWQPGGFIRLEMMVDPSIPGATMQAGHFRWPFLCDDCEWLGTRPAWSQQLQGSASEALDVLPLDLDRNRLNDLVVARREQMVFFRVDTCAATPQISGLGGMALPDFSLQRELRPMSLGTSAAGVLHPGEGLLMHTGGQNEGLRVLARSGPDNSPAFTQLVLEDGSFAGSPLLAEPVRLEPDHLCQDLLVGTRGGDLVLFPANSTCSQIEPDSARVLFSGLGTPLDMLVVQGTRLAPGAFEDYVLVLDAAPEPLHCLTWNGSTLVESWTAPPDLVQNLERLEAWSDGDAAGLPDLIAWNGDGRVVVVANINPATQQATITAWDFPEPLRDVESLPDGRVLFAGYASLRASFDPAAGQLVTLNADLPDVPRRLRAIDINSDGDHDLMVLYQDGRLLASLDEPVGADRLELPDSLSWSRVAVGDTLRVPLTFRHRGTSGLMRLDVSPPPADPAFPFSWADETPRDLAPGDSLVLELRVHAAVPLDSCWDAGQFNVWWSFPGCTGQSGQVVLDLCLQAGRPLPRFSLDSLDLGTDCGGHAGCEPVCPRDGFWLRNQGDATLHVLEARLDPHPSDSLSAPESFCLLQWPQAALAPGDSAWLELSYCPPMTGPWPWRQGALLSLRTNATGADSLLQLPVLGLLTCPWPPRFTADLPEMPEDLAGWLDLAPLIEDPDDPLAELSLTVHGVVGTDGLAADSLLRLEDVDGLRLRVTPQANVNSALYPRLGLDLELADPSGNHTRDTLLFVIRPVDDPPVFRAGPDSLLTVREGRTLRMDFQWREVDGDVLLSSFTLYRDAAHQDLLETQSFSGTDSWRYERALAEGDSALYGGQLFWQALLADPSGGQGFTAELAGRWLITSRRDTLAMSEDRELVLDLAGWLLSPGEDPAGMQADLLSVFGTGDVDPADVLETEALGGLLFRLTPAPDVNADRVPGLSLLFQLQEAGQPARRDTLRVAIRPEDDDPRLLLAPAADATLPEGAETLLSWEVAEVDGDALTGGLLLSHHPLFADTLAWLPLTGSTRRLDLAYRPEVGDSLRLGGQLHWRLGVVDAPPAGGSLDLQRSLGILQSPQHLQLNLRSTPPVESHWGDTLSLAVRVFSATGYVGGLVLRLEQDLQEVVRVDWPWLDLTAGAVLDTTLSLVMPLDGLQSCWTLTLLPGNPAEDETDNTLEDCVQLTRESLGPEQRGFSPNGDGINDELRFTFSARPARTRYRVEIFDAGGHRVVARELGSGEHSWSWDGRSSGRELLPGVYAWVMLDGEQVLARGQLGVVR